MVLDAVASENVAVPGPETLAHRDVRVDPAGSPSSVTEPASVMPAGRVTVRSGPAFAIGAWFPIDGSDTASSCIVPSFSLGLALLSWPRATTYMFVTDGFANDGASTTSSGWRGLATDRSMRFSNVPDVVVSRIIFVAGSTTSRVPRTGSSRAPRIPGPRTGRCRTT